MENYLNQYTDIQQMATVLGWIREPEELFGYSKADVKSHFRKLAKRLHPDVASKDNAARAEAAIKRLNELYEEAQSYIEADTYTSKRLTTVVKIKDVEYFVLHTFNQDDIATSYMLLDNSLMRIPIGTDTNDLMKAEVAALTLLNSKAYEGTKPLFPVLQESLLAKTPDGTKRINILNYNNTTDNPEKLLTLRQLGDYYQQHLDAKQIAWIWRKLLMALDMTHSAEIVHGSVSPDSILIEPNDHLICLTNWEFSTLNRAALIATCTKNEGFYPPEINVDGKTTFGLDLYMGAKSMLWAGGEVMPDAMQAYFNWIASLSTHGRTQDAYMALSEFDELIHVLWGERKYTPMPDLFWPIHVEDVA